MFSSPRMQLAGVLVRRDARLAGPHFMRGWLAVALWFAVWQTASQTWRQASGHDLLSSLLMFSAFGLVFAATHSFTSVFTDDWTASNLDMLRLTGLGAFDLLLAKSLPHAITAATLIVIQLPFALVCVTLGGVTLGQIAALAVELAAFFAVAAGCAVIWGVQVSVGGLKPGTARFLAFLTLGAYLFATAMLDMMLAEIRRLAGLPGTVNGPWLNPVSEFARILSSGFTDVPVNWTLLVHLLWFAVVFISSGSLLGNQWHLAQPDDGTADPQPAELEAPPLWRPNQPPPRCTGNPILWKEYYFTLGGVEMLTGKWAVSLFVASVGLFLVILAAAGAGLGFMLGLLGFLAVVATVSSLSFCAARLWQTELRERTLGGLALLPWSAEELLLAKLTALVWISLPEIVILALATLAALMLGQWTAAALIGGLFASLPLVVCTDTAWRFIPATWAGLASKAKLVGMVLATWCLAGLIGWAVHPLVGLTTLLLVVPWATWAAFAEAAHWFGLRADELSEW